MITMIQDGGRTYVIPAEPMQCGRCGCMSGIFLNRRGETACCRCDVEDRTLPQYRKDGDYVSMPEL